MASRDSRDLEDLVVLDFELPSLRVSVQLAEVFSEGTKLAPIRHPVMAFALDKAPASVAENLLLRVPEILEVLQRARVRLGLSSVFAGNGRGRKPSNSVLRLAYEIRQERVAHRVQFGIYRQPAWERLVAEYGNVWAFLKSVLDQLQILVDEVRATGSLDKVVPSWPAARKEYDPFTLQDLEELLVASERLSVVRNRGAV